MVRIKGLHKEFGPLHILKGIDLDVAPGEVCVLLGPSGSGKSTLLRCINQLETFEAGEIWVGGERVGYEHDPLPDGRLKRLSDKEIAAQRARVGMVFQRFNLFPHMTALGNVMEAPIKVSGLSKEEAEPLAVSLLERVGMADRADHYPAELSGGQQQRVAIARALMMEPAVLLFDEPTAALDPEITAQIVSIIRELAQTNITQVIVTHEVEVARKTASRVVYMENGYIVEQGDASRFTQPQTDAFANYLSH